ncbi:aldo/keto reductase [Nocardioides sp. CFH 31398]|uniref:aldo/keto reductase n=1 Tax=Nocardioides sp. CFH 31398 TaxID=2919579 RepID=UPI001F061D11|nr:aldo/keto reductase [Nocardioides sp. CFH 31398]MCH1867445.1 aldo/keto reductase [Nocardioides sp. CFH 31398]
MRPETTVPTVQLPAGESVPAMGLGTWYLGEDAGRRASEVAALRQGLDSGLTLVDTAEMYGSGAAEVLVGEALGTRRDEVFLVSKVLPSNSGYEDTLEACRRSLSRLGTDRLDLYLLHWRGRVPLAETVRAFQELVRRGMIRYWGVSNFDLHDMVELEDVPGGEGVQVDQVLYNLTRRGIEYDLLDTMRVQGVPVMAYSPIEQGRLLDHPALAAVAERLDATPAQVALAWVMTREGVLAIPRAGTPEHVRENRAALDLRLGEQDLQALDEAFPPPRRHQPLEVL